MRRWLALLFIALLPLRGWVGDAMAGEMIQMQLSHSPAQVMAVHDCPGHEEAAMPASATDAHSGGAHPAADGNMPDDCATCASCQACSAVALALPLVDLRDDPPPSSTPPFHATPPANAERARDLRPPIA